MVPKISARIGILALLILLLNLTFGMIITNRQVWAAPNFAADQFNATWNYSDKAVEEIPGVGRGYTWGPSTYGTFQEDYIDAPQGKRIVQYFDKSRMELSTGSDGKIFVTNGLLTKELVTGKRQDGNNAYNQFAPSTVQVAGDDNSTGGNQIAPVYASFRNVVTINPGENGAPDQTGKIVEQAIDVKGTTTVLSTPPVNIKNDTYYPQTGHNVPSVFSTFINSTGKIWDGSKYIEGHKIYGENPIALTFGFPISEAYWSQAIVAGHTRNVLIQLFERRVLTYTPENPDPFKVEMGNIGQHYYKWRYNNIVNTTVSNTPTTTVTPSIGGTLTPGTTPPSSTPTPTTQVGNMSGTLVFDNISANTYADQIYSINPDNSNKNKIAQGSYPIFSSDAQHIAFLADVSNTNGNPAGTVVVRTSKLDGTDQQDFCKLNSNAYQLVTLERWSPDGQSIILATTTTDSNNLISCNLQAKSLSGALKTNQGQLVEVYDWTSDGKKAIWESNLPNNDLKYAIYFGTADNSGSDAVTVTNGQYLINNDVNDGQTPQYYACAALSPDRKTVAVCGSVVFFVSLPGQKSQYENKTLDAFTIANRIAWSPDGHSIAILNDTTLSIINLDNGQVSKIADDVAFVDWSTK